MKKQAGWMAVAVTAAAIMMVVGAGPLFAAEQRTPDSSSWQYFEAVETGNFPSQEMLKPVRKSGIEQAGVFERIDLGGISYRIGLDTN